MKSINIINTEIIEAIQAKLKSLELYKAEIAPLNMS